MEMIKVLWMNNGEEGLQQFVEKGKDYHLSITTCQCMTDCRHKLNDVNNSWDAIILNAEVKEMLHQKPSATGLIKATNDVRGRNIPWFIVSLKEIRNKAMLMGVLPEHERPYFINSEPENLFDAIRIRVNNNPRIVVREKYADVYRYCPNIENLLVKLEYGNVQTDVTILNECRKILEWIRDESLLSDMYISEEIIKELVIHYKKNGKRFPYTETYSELSLNDFSYAVCRSANVPVFVQRSLYSCVSTANPGSHNTDVDSAIRSGNAPYVTKTLIYDLLNIIHWCASLNENTFEL